MNPLASSHESELLREVAHGLGAELEPTLAELDALYARLDRALAGRQRDLALPCGAGCDACCTSSPRVTLLEYLGLVEYLERSEQLPDFVTRALELAERHGPELDALSTAEAGPTPEQPELAFRCPALDSQGRCLGYPRRPAVCRLFGSSFDDDDRLYACGLVAEALAGQELTLPRARPWLQRLRELPLTGLVMVMPGFARLLARSAAGQGDAEAL